MRIVLIILVAVIAIFLGYVASRPSQMHIERSTTIAAAPAAVYAEVADFHQWDKWSPWDKYDPHMQKSYSGDAGAVGSSYEWTGNNKVGTGAVILTAAQPPARLEYRLEFRKPMQAVNSAVFAFAPEGAGTKVTWSMDGKNNFLAKFFGVFMDVDKLVGGDFETGLASLKQLSEAGGAAAPGAAHADSAAAAPAK